MHSIRVFSQLFVGSLSRTTTVVRDTDNMRSCYEMGDFTVRVYIIYNIIWTFSLLERCLLTAILLRSMIFASKI